MATSLRRAFSLLPGLRLGAMASTPLAGSSRGKATAISTGIPIIKPTQLAALKVKWHKEKLAGIEPEPPEIPSPLPFHIYRSRMGNLPVYTDLKLNTSRSYTLVRKVSGDVKTLAQLLQHVCRTKVRLYHGRIQITGKEHRERVEEFLTSLGF